MGGMVLTGFLNGEGHSNSHGELGPFSSALRNLPWVTVQGVSNGVKKTLTWVYECFLLIRIIKIIVAILITVQLSSFHTQSHLILTTTPRAGPMLSWITATHHVSYWALGIQLLSTEMCCKCKCTWDIEDVAPFPWKNGKYLTKWCFDTDYTLKW